MNLISEYVPNIDTYGLDDEWNDIPYSFTQNEKNIYVEDEILKFWSIVENKKALTGDLLFPNLIKIYKFVASLPDSNADAERIFSMVTDVKNKKRNRIGEPCLNAVCMIKSSFNNKNVNSLTLPNEKHNALFNSNNIYKNN